MSLQRAKGRLSLDPGRQTCPSCDMELDSSVVFTNGLCPYCAREKELAEDAEEEKGYAE